MPAGSSLVSTIQQAAIVTSGSTHAAAEFKQRPVQYLARLAAAGKD